MKHFQLHRLPKILVTGCLSAGSIFAAAICAPHTGEGVELITDTATAFCVGASGYSKEWYSSPAINTNAFNLLGESAQFLTYHTVEGDVTRSQWLSPEVAGALTSTNFVLGAALSVLNNTATSTINDTHVQVAITSTTINNNIKQTFTITNIEGGTTIDWIELVTYLQYFPHGQTNPNTGTLSYEPVPTIENTYEFGLWAHGQAGSPSFVREGGVCGGVGPTCTLPDRFMIDTPSNVLAAVLLTAGTPLGNALTSLDMTSGSAAGALSWRATNLNLILGDGSQTFTIELVPEPGTAALFLIAAGAFVIRRRFAA